MTVTQAHHVSSARLGSMPRLDLSEVASGVLQVSTRSTRARAAAQRVLAAGTPILRVLCSVMCVVLVSTLLREPTTAVCVLLVASMAIWTHLQRVWSAVLVGTLLLG